jgi:hypothetical protein
MTGTGHEVCSLVRVSEELTTQHTAQPTYCPPGTTPSPSTTRGCVDPDIFLTQDGHYFKGGIHGGSSLWIN